MATVVSLRAVVNELEVLGEGSHSFLNRHTGELYGGTDELLAKAEEAGDEDLLGWEVEIVDKLREILQSKEWLEVPSRSSHEDYRVMERFCGECCEGQAQEELLSAIRGRGAFGRFKDGIYGEGQGSACAMLRLAVASSPATHHLSRGDRTKKWHANRHGTGTE